jgi:hypothetical protein
MKSKFLRIVVWSNKNYNNYKNYKKNMTSKKMEMKKLAITAQICSSVKFISLKGCMSRLKVRSLKIDERDNK